MKLIRTSFAVLCCLLIILNSVDAQVKTRRFTGKVPVTDLPVKTEITKKIILNGVPALNGESRAKESDIGPYKTGSVLETDINFIDEAASSADGNIITYTLNLTAERAFSIRLGFSTFFLSKNAVFSLYTERELTAEITAAENNYKKRWATRSYSGNSINLVLKIPVSEKGESELVISKVCFGFAGGGPELGHPGNAAYCTVNVACEAANGWDNEKKSVTNIESFHNNGSYAFSGTLIMNSCSTTIPYVLTAEHNMRDPCDDWVFLFKYWSTSCTITTGYSDDVAFYGATEKARHTETDFGLVQMDQTPSAALGLYYAGWSRNTSGIQNVTMLHHPKGDVMKISRDNSAPVSYNSYFNPVSGVYIEGWKIDLDNVLANGIYTDAATETGSSGSPYFNDDHRIIGQHYGTLDGQATCASTIKLAGRFDQSWIGNGTNSTRLSNWLDPSGSNALTTNTTSSANLVSLVNNTYYINGPTQLCTSATYTVPNLPAGATLTWYVEPYNNYVSFSVSSNVLTVTRIMDGDIIVEATVNYCGYTFYNELNVRSGGEPIIITPTQTGCDEMNISVSGAATGATHNWSSAGSSILYNGTSTTASTTNNSIYATGTEDIIILNTTNTCSQSVPVYYSYYPFNRLISGVYPEYVSCGDQVLAIVNTTLYDTYYRWYVNNILVKEGESAFYYCTCSYEGLDAFQPIENNIRVEVDVSCNVTRSADVNFSWYCMTLRSVSNLDLYPNPADRNVTVRLKDLNARTRKDGLSDIRFIRIYDKFGSVRKMVTQGAGTKLATIDISMLPTDVYFVEVSDGKNMIRVPLSIQR
jgi:lysyl endopeptidase